jgi:hypothetical protein
MEGNYTRSREMEGHGVGGKNSNRVIKASDDDDDDNKIYR